jgi:transcriptional regulator with XRE-family HTH domain
MTDNNLVVARKQPLCNENRYNTVVMEKFGDWLRRHRKALGLLQSQVASRAGVSTSYISTLERAQKHSITGADLVPDREKLAAIAKAVNGNVNEALRFFGYAPNQPTETFDILDLATVMFHDADRLTPEEKEELLTIVRRVAAGMISERGKDR